MGLMDGKTALVFGVANRNSIAWGIAQRLHEEGARIGLSYAGEALRKRVLPLAENIDCDFVEPCDVTDDAAIDSVSQKRAFTSGRSMRSCIPSPTPHEMTWMAAWSTFHARAFNKP